MATGWLKKLKSLQCKSSRSTNDVVQSHQILKENSRKPDGGTRADRRRFSRSSESCFPALTGLPEGHPSRNVVEIIFHTSWSPMAFPGRIEMVFKVQNSGRTVSRFEEYRELVKLESLTSVSGAGEDDNRCVVDGNEVMRFQCTGGGGETGGGWWFGAGKGAGAVMCTFSGSGVAHERGGGGRGRKMMVVCRVIAGRVRKRGQVNSVNGCDSVSGENGELVVFDSRAVLPCFLIVYRL